VSYSSGDMPDWYGIRARMGFITRVVGEEKKRGKAIQKSATTEFKVHTILLEKSKLGAS